MLKFQKLNAIVSDVVTMLRRGFYYGRRSKEKG